MPISQTSSTVSLTAEQINIGNVGIFSNVGSTINPMTLTTGSISLSNTTGTVNVTGTVSLTMEQITVGNVGVLSNTGSTINPMAMTGGSVTFSNSSGTVQIGGFTPGGTQQVDIRVFTTTNGTINLPSTSTIGVAASFPSTSTVGISFTNAQTGTIGAAIAVSANQTGTIPVTFGTGTVTMVSTSTVIFSSTSGTVNVGGFSASVFSGTFATTSPTNSGGGATSTVVSVGTSASTLLSASASRVYAHFRHATVSTGTIFIRHGLVPTTTNYDTYLNMTAGGGDVYEITQTNLWTGDLQAISSTNTSSISILSF